MARSNRQDLFLNIRGDVADLRTATAAGKTVLNEFTGAAVNVLEQVEKKFGELGQTALPNIRKTEQAYVESFKRIRDAANAGADAGPVKAFEILDANKARQQAEAATVRATALREVAAAASRADAAEQGNNAATRAYAVAAATAAIEAEQLAQGLRDQASVLTGVERQLDSTGKAQGRAVVMTGQARSGYQQLSYQLNDISTMYAMGASSSQIFASQSGQVIQALQLIGGEGNKALAFLGSWQGMLVATAVIAVTPMITKLLAKKDALAQATEELKKEAAQTEVSARAKDAFARSEEGVAAAIRDATKARNDSVKAEMDSAERANIAAKNNRENAIAIRQMTLARIEDMKVLIAAQLLQASGTGERGDMAALGLPRLQEQLAELTEAAEAQARQIAATEQEVQQSRIDLATEAAKRMADPIARITKLYDDQAQAARDAARAAAEGGQEVTVALRDQLAQIERNKQAALQAERDRQSAASRGSSGQLASFLSPVAGGRQSGGFGEQRSGHRHGGIDYAVPAGTPVRATAAGAVDFAGQRGNYGNLIIINNGAGTSTRFAHLSRLAVERGQQVSAGEVIGYSGGVPGTPGAGRSTGAHLHYEVRRNGRAVDPRTGRFPTDQGSVEDAVARSAEQAEREREAEARRREAEERRQVQNADEYQRLLMGVRERQVSIERSRVTTIGEAADLDVQAVEMQRADIDRAAQKGVELGKWTQAQADAVKQIALQNALNEQLGIRTEETLALAQRRFEIEQAELSDRAEMLRLHGQLATTNAERRDIARQLLRIEREQVEAALRNRIANTRDPEVRAGLQRQLDSVGGEYDLRGQQLERDFADPLQRYRQQLIESTADMNEALQGVAVNGFRALEDAGSREIANILKLKGAYGDFVSSVIADLARLAIRKAMLSALGGGFFGLADGGKIADVPGYADGGIPFVDQGLIHGPGDGRSDSILALVGGRKPIRVSNGEAIVNERGVRNHWPLIKAINEDRLPKFADGGLVGAAAMNPRLPNLEAARRAMRGDRRDRVEVDARVRVDAGPEFDARVESVSARTVASAAEPIMAAAHERTMRTLGRPGLPGSY
jgi:murein DD-endopeptidase MepM/ murein hydrolase activator NlpD